MGTDGSWKDLGAVDVAGCVETAAIEDSKKEETQDGEPVTHSVARVCKLGYERCVDTQVDNASHLVIFVRAMTSQENVEKYENLLFQKSSPEYDQNDREPWR